MTADGGRPRRARGGLTREAWMIEEQKGREGEDYIRRKEVLHHHKNLAIVE